MKNRYLPCHSLCMSWFYSRNNYLIVALQYPVRCHRITHNHISFFLLFYPHLFSLGGGKVHPFNWIGLQLSKHLVLQLKKNSAIEIRLQFEIAIFFRVLWRRKCFQNKKTNNYTLKRRNWNCYFAQWVFFSCRVRVWRATDLCGSNGFGAFHIDHNHQWYQTNYQSVTTKTIHFCIKV